MKLPPYLSLTYNWFNSNLFQEAKPPFFLCLDIRHVHVYVYHYINELFSSLLQSIVIVRMILTTNGKYYMYTEYHNVCKEITYTQS